MFQMMNAARYEVGLQGCATASAAHQAALAYAKERLQGRSMTNREPQARQVPIIEHPDVRRSLLLQAAYVQAMRALVSYTGWCMDMAHVTEGEEHDRWQGLVELLTPVCKAWCSDWGFRVTEWALQTFGGYGYTCEYPAEQYLRDAKIASIYEGTNGIQALDLVGRKFRMQEGKPVKHLMGLAGQAAQTLAADPVLGPSAMQLGAAVKALGAVLTEIPTKENAMLLTVLNAVPRPGHAGPRGERLPAPPAGCARQGEARGDPEGEGCGRGGHGRRGRAPEGQRRSGLLPQQGPGGDPLRPPRACPSWPPRPWPCAPAKWPPWRPCFREDIHHGEHGAHGERIKRASLFS